MDKWYCYSRGIEAAPTTSSGPSSRETTASGGQPTSGPSSITTTAAGGEVISTETGDNLWKLKGDYGIDVASPVGGHNHGIPQGTQLAIDGGGSVTWSPQHDHSHGLEAHYHRFSLGDHVHNMDHFHVIGAHAHGMDHTHEIPGHKHDIQHGIFEGPTPNAVTVKVDGNVIPNVETNVQELDIVPYLSKDGSGKIQRGWHEIEIAPNSLGRIVASIFTQLFAQSRGGGNH